MSLYNDGPQGLGGDIEPNMSGVDAKPTEALFPHKAALERVLTEVSIPADASALVLYDPKTTTGRRNVVVIGANHKGVRHAISTLEGLGLSFSTPEPGTMYRTSDDSLGNGFYGEAWRIETAFRGKSSGRAMVGGTVFIPLDGLIEECDIPADTLVECVNMASNYVRLVRIT